MNTVHSLSYKHAQLNIQFVYVFPKVLAMCWLGEMLFADILFECHLSDESAYQQKCFFYMSFIRFVLHHWMLIV